MTAFVPDWTRQPDFLGAIKAGAEIGLKRRDLARQELEAAQRNALGYAEIGSRERGQAQHDAAATEDAKLRADALLSYRNTESGQRASAAQQLEDYRNAQLGLGTSRLDFQKSQAADRSKLLQGKSDTALMDKMDADGATSSALQWLEANPERTPAEAKMAYPLAKIPMTAMRPKSASSALTAHMANEIYDRSLAGVGGGTNTVAAIDEVNKYRNPTAAPDEMSAGDSLTAPSAVENVDGLPDSTQVPTVNSQSEYDALPAGSKYIDSNGNLATKKK